MAAFPRGLTSSFLHPHAFRLPSTLRATLLNTRLHAARVHPPSQSRSFSKSLLRRYAASARVSYASLGTYVSSDPVLRSVTQTRQPVLLYKEPPRSNYLWKVYAWATTSTAIGLFCFWWVHALPEGLPFFVAPVYIVMGVGFVAIGIHIYQRPVRRIATLEVIPGTMGGRLQLRLRGKKEPWAKDQVIVTDIFNATISEKTGPMIAEIVEAERARRQRITEDLEGFGILGKVWEVTARFVEQKWTSFFLKFKFAVLQFGIIHVEVDGVRWKIDCTGYLREQGAAVDRILPVE
ncbi:hypothetical protein BU23DRAFT_604409 [Bimuria novae-zelandiae CBS 107.79]|uniref:Uncharacterized protein n=1 Tax=Bimuria novae-zelandiae CBS 107.79 TaxID=1447943 RepID=A0A6A5UKA6_9PLEO|nr:hypothetical protein BU23DRAFT_604409 [Bimuria novae-zelandiae CBS 107.79]